MFGKLTQIFGKKERLLPPVDLSSLVVDVHSHLIPGIDDGSPDMETTLQLLNSFLELGYKKVITTPHVMSDAYRNTPEIIQSGLADVRSAIEANDLNIEIECAAEYYLDTEVRNLLKEDGLLTFGNDYVLFELSFMSEPPFMDEFIFELQLKGLKPVLAHPERYLFWHQNFDRYRQLHDKGVILQLNMNSLTGHYSPQVKKIAYQLIDEELIGFVGSDCHHAGHIALMQQARQLEPLHRLMASGALLNSSL